MSSPLSQESKNYFQSAARYCLAVEGGNISPSLNKERLISEDHISAYRLAKGKIGRVILSKAEHQRILKIALDIVQKGVGELPAGDRLAGLEMLHIKTMGDKKVDEMFEGMRAARRMGIRATAMAAGAQVGGAGGSFAGGLASTGINHFIDKLGKSEFTLPVDVVRSAFSGQISPQDSLTLLGFNLSQGARQFVVKKGLECHYERSSLSGDYSDLKQWLGDVLKQSGLPAQTEGENPFSLAEDLLSPLKALNGDQNPLLDEISSIACSDRADLAENLFKSERFPSTEEGGDFLARLVEEDMLKTEEEIESLIKQGEVALEQMQKDEQFKQNAKQLIGSVVRNFAHGVEAVRRVDEEESAFKRRVEQMAESRIRSSTPWDCVPLQSRLYAAMASETKLYQTIEELRKQREEIKFQGGKIRDSLRQYKDMAERGNERLSKLNRIYPKFFQDYRKKVQIVQGVATGVELTIDIACMAAGSPGGAGQIAGQILRLGGESFLRGPRRRVALAQRAMDRNNDNVNFANQHFHQASSKLEQFTMFLLQNPNALLPHEYRQELANASAAFDTSISKLEKDKKENLREWGKSCGKLADAKEKGGSKPNKKQQAQIEKYEGEVDFYNQINLQYESEINSQKRQQADAQKELRWQALSAPFHDRMSRVIEGMRQSRSWGDPQVDRMQRELLERRNQYLQERRMDTEAVNGLFEATSLLTNEVVAFCFQSNQGVENREERARRDMKVRDTSRRVSQTLDFLSQCYEVYDQARYWVEFGIPSILSIGEVFSDGNQRRADLMVNRLNANARRNNAMGDVAPVVSDMISSLGGFKALKTIFSKAGITTYLIPGIKLIGSVIKGIRLFRAWLKGERVKSEQEVLLENIQNMLKGAVEFLVEHLNREFDRVHEHLRENHKEVLEEFKQVRSEQMRGVMALMDELASVKDEIKEHIDRQTFDQQIKDWEGEDAKFKEKVIIKRVEKYVGVIANNTHQYYTRPVITLNGEQGIPPALMPLQPAFFTGHLGAKAGLENVPQAMRFIWRGEQFLKDAKSILTKPKLHRVEVECLKNSIPLLMDQSIELVRLSQKEAFETFATKTFEKKNALFGEFNRIVKANMDGVHEIARGHLKKPLYGTENPLSGFKAANRFTLRRGPTPEAFEEGMRAEEARKFFLSSYEPEEAREIAAFQGLSWCSDLYRDFFYDFETLLEGNSEEGKLSPVPFVKRSTIEPNTFEMLADNYNRNVALSRKYEARFAKLSVELVNLMDRTLFQRNGLVIDEPLIEQGFPMIPENDSRLPLPLPKEFFQHMLSKYSEKLLGYLFFSGGVFATYQIKKSDPFEMILNIREKDTVDILLTTELTSWDKKSFQAFSELSFNEETRNSRQRKRSLLDIKQAKMEPFLAQYFFASKVEMGFPGKGTRIVKFDKDKVKRNSSETDYEPFSHDLLTIKYTGQKEMGFETYECPVPVDHKFDGLFDILVRYPEKTLHYDCDKYDGNEPQTLKSMLKTRKITFQKTLDPNPHKSAEQKQVEELLKEYQQAYHELKALILWKSSISEDELKEELESKFSLVEITSLKDFYIKALSGESLPIAEDFGVTAFDTMLDGLGASDNLARVKKLQKRIAKLKNQVDSKLA